MNENEIAKLPIAQLQKCEGVITEKELLEALTKLKCQTINHLEKMESQKNFMKSFWDELKILFLPSFAKDFLRRRTKYFSETSSDQTN